MRNWSVRAGVGGRGGRREEGREGGRELEGGRHYLHGTTQMSLSQHLMYMYKLCKLSSCDSCGGGERRGGFMLQAVFPPASTLQGGPPVSF